MNRFLCMSFVVLALGIPISSLSVSVEAQTTLSRNRSSVSGFVFDSGRRPITNVWVELVSDVNSTVGRMKTDASGRFYFPGLANGRYTIRVKPYGTNLEEQSEDIELAGLGSRGQSLPDNQQKDIYLKERRGGSEPFSNEVVYAQEIPKDAETAYKSAIEDLSNQHTDTAAASLEKAVNIFPDYFAALLKLGSIRLAQQQYPVATSLFNRAIAVNPRCFDCNYGIAFAEYMSRQYGSAVNYAEKALAERSGSLDANLLLGMAARMTKAFKKAEDALIKASKTAEGKNADVHWQLALLYGRDLERFSDAAKHLELYLKAYPDAPNKEAVKKLIKQFKEKTSA